MVDSQAMRETLRLWASGVSVVSTALRDPLSGDITTQSGMTVSAFNSLSLEPPLILVCLHKDAQTANLIMQTQVFAVSFLAAGQSHLSDRFAGRVPGLEGSERYQGLDVVRASTGSPILADSVAWLDCVIQTVHDGGTHWIVIGAVQATGRGTGTAPLLYYDRAYRELALVAN